MPQSTLVMYRKKRLYDVMKEIGKCAYTSPGAECIQFKCLMDGDVLFTEFMDNVSEV